MFLEDTIAAISTPLGTGGIGIVRLSGREAIKIADKVFRSPKKKKIKQTPSHRIIYGHIMNPETKDVVDEALVSVMKAPNTYTKEDTVEINCHGGAVPLRRVLELVLEKGARIAEPGEFTQRAFINGRIDLTQAEAVLDVINALTVESQKTAVRQLRGKLSEKIEAIRDRLIELTAFVEAYIDFPEEDIEPISAKEMKKMALQVQKPLRKLIDSSRYGLILREGLKAAIIGRPNVGKSSLLNALLEHDRAIVTEIPGTTRDVIEDYLNIQGLPVNIMDTAGIRSVEDIAEKEGVKRSIRAMEEADLVLIILDGSEALHKADRDLIEKSNAKKTIYVINKIDLPQKMKFKSFKRHFHPPISPLGKGGMKGGSHSPAKIVRVSAKKGTGLNRLKDTIMETVLNGQTGYSPNIVTNVRHVRALERALASVNSFLQEIPEKTSPELLSIELREALDAIGEILGITTPEDILNRIFSNFCIGK
jgi:tRNA modification GTPase